ncbi:MAG: TIGR03067 domain-containing protein [Verrucomicrobiota bacterium]
MKTLRNPLLIAIAVLVISSARGADSDAAKKDLTLLHGEWSMVSGTADGLTMSEEIRKQMKRVCQGNETTTTMGDQVFLKAKITIDPSKKPKTINYQMTEGPNKGETQLGIYEVDGKTFKTCFSKPGAERPADFTSKPGDSRTCSVWKREKSPAEPAQKITSIVTSFLSLKNDSTFVA